MAIGKIFPFDSFHTLYVPVKSLSTIGTYIRWFQQTYSDITNILQLLLNQFVWDSVIIEAVLSVRSMSVVEIHVDD